MSLTRFERALMESSAWRAYMAGRHAANRDEDMVKARKVTDPVIRSIHVRNARLEHRYFLKCARAALQINPQWTRGSESPIFSR